MESSPVRGVAAGVPYVAMAPWAQPAGAPVVLGWSSARGPNGAEAMATMWPLARLPAWRVYLDLPRSRDKGPEADVVGSVVHVAVEEMPAVLADLRERIPFPSRPLGLLGASVGAAVAQRAGIELGLDVSALALVSPVTWRIDQLVEHRPRPAVLVVTAADDDESCHEHAVDLWQALSTTNGTPERTSLVTIPPNRSIPPTNRMDAVLTGWFGRHLVP